MLSNISPLRPNPREDATSGSDRVKPHGPPRDDSFRKSMDERRPKKDEEEQASSVRERKPSSLFDLSKTNKPKSKSTFAGSKSTSKDSESSGVTQRAVTAKQSQDHGEESDQDQSLGQTKSPNEGVRTVSREKPVELSSSEEKQYAHLDGEAPSQDIPFQEAPQDALSQEIPPESTPEQDIAKSQNTQPQTPLQTQMKKPMEQATLSQPMDALKNAHAASALQHPQKVKGTKEDSSSFESDKLGGTSKKLKSSKGDEAGSKSETAETRGDAAAVNSSIQSTGFQTEKAPESQETTRSATIRDLATQIIDRIQIMRKGDETQTTITLRHPPVLEGATITLTASDHAKREFNISFANLTPEAKLLLDRKLREDPLTDTLERKGIVVHMLTTSTQAEPTFTVDAGQASRDRQDQQQQQQEQQQRRQKFQTSEDEEVT